MPTHHDYEYKTERVPKTFECNGGCIEHGPFPTPWRAQGMYSYGGLDEVVWHRYTGPYTMEATRTKAPPPAEKAP